MQQALVQTLAEIRTVLENPCSAKHTSNLINQLQQLVDKVNCWLNEPKGIIKNMIGSSKVSQIKAYLSTRFDDSLRQRKESSTQQSNQSIFAQQEQFYQINNNSAGQLRKEILRITHPLEEELARLARDLLKWKISCNSEQLPAERIGLHYSLKDLLRVAMETGEIDIQYSEDELLFRIFILEESVTLLLRKAHFVLNELITMALKKKGKETKTINQGCSSISQSIKLFKSKELKQLRSSEPSQKYKQNGIHPNYKIRSKRKEAITEIEQLLQG